ncbi:MAG: hypothetical protein V5A43_01770 [Haloarculaceae archaeon]
MRHSSARAGTEPLAALAAVFAVGVGLAAFAGAVPVPDPTGSPDPAAVLQEVRLDATTDGVLHPTALDVGESVPAGWQVNVTLETPTGRRHLGPEPPDRAERADRSVTVAQAPGVLVPGHLEVEVW